MKDSLHLGDLAVDGGVVAKSRLRMRVLYLIIAAVFLLGVFAGPSHEPRGSVRIVGLWLHLPSLAEAGRYYGGLLMLLLALAVGFTVNTILHESAHAIVGKTLGLPVASVHFGFWGPVVARFRAYGGILWTMTLFPCFGRVSLQCHDGSNCVIPRWKVRLVAAAGPIASVIVLLVIQGSCPVVEAFRFLNHCRGPGTPGWILYFVSASLWIAIASSLVASLIPFSPRLKFMNGLLSDAWIFISGQHPDLEPSNKSASNCRV